MAEYIEREALKAEFDCMSVYVENELYLRLLDVGKFFQSIPAADVVEVKHGKWVSHDFEVTFSCSKCDFTTDFHLSKYCPNCGARMDGE